MKKLLMLGLAFTGAAVLSFSAGVASAATNCAGGAPSTATINQDPSKGPVVQSYDRQCDPALNNNTCSGTDINATNCDLIGKYLQPAVEFVSALFGVGVVIAIAYGGIEYASSGGDPQKAAAGKNRIRNAIIALLAYVFLYALLNFLIPGGIA